MRYISQQLKYCPTCLIEDEVKYGEPYWHRVHQLRGVFYCPEHRDKLVYSAIQCRTKYPTVALTKEVKIAPEQPEFIDKRADFWTAVGKAYKWLLFNRTRLEPDSIISGYKQLLSECGFTLHNGNVNIVRLHKQFEEFIADQYLGDCEYILSRSKGWLSRIFSSNKRDIHPLRHVVLMLFLKKEPRKFLSKKVLNTICPKKDLGGFGEGRWPCLNPLSDYYLQPVVSDHSVKRGRRYNQI